MPAQSGCSPPRVREAVGEFQDYGCQHFVLLHHFTDHGQLLRECLLYINEIVVSRLDSIDVPSPCNPHDLVKVIAQEIEGNWVEILKQHLALDRNSALGLIASTEGLAVLEAVFSRSASRLASF